MFSSSNNTTTKIGQAQATVIADTVYNNNRITTLELLYPRYIHSELMTHRVMSRNASSSRATPISVLVHDARNPVFFDFVGVNKSGMQASQPVSPEVLEKFHDEWIKLANDVADWVERMSELYNIHKQTLNRVLEPFTCIRTLVTATTWDNFFKLRLDEHAQPEMQSLAKAMKLAMEKSKPKTDTVHIPYVQNPTDFYIDSKVSVARCARVSYGRLDGKPNDVQADINLFNQLASSGHMSPFEHVATASDGQYANFTGWKSLRYDMETK